MRFKIPELSTPLHELETSSEGEWRVQNQINFEHYSREEYGTLISEGLTLSDVITQKQFDSLYSCVKYFNLLGANEKQQVTKYLSDIVEQINIEVTETIKANGDRLVEKERVEDEFQNEDENSVTPSSRPSEVLAQNNSRVLQFGEEFIESINIYVYFMCKIVAVSLQNEDLINPALFLTKTPKKSKGKLKKNMSQNDANGAYRIGDMLAPLDGLTDIFAKNDITLDMLFEKSSHRRQFASLILSLLELTVAPTLAAKAFREAEMNTQPHMSNLFVNLASFSTLSFETEFATRISVMVSQADDEEVSNLLVSWLEKLSMKHDSTSLIVACLERVLGDLDGSNVKLISGFIEALSGCSIIADKVFFSKSNEQLGRNISFSKSYHSLIGKFGDDLYMFRCSVVKSVGNLIQIIPRDGFAEESLNYLLRETISTIMKSLHDNNSFVRLAASKVMADLIETDTKIIVKLDLYIKVAKEIVSSVLNKFHLVRRQAMQSLVHMVNTNPYNAILNGRFYESKLSSFTETDENSKYVFKQCSDAIEFIKMLEGLKPILATMLKSDLQNDVIGAIHLINSCAHARVSCYEHVTFPSLIPPQVLHLVFRDFGTDDKVLPALIEILKAELKPASADSNLVVGKIIDFGTTLNSAELQMFAYLLTRAISDSAETSDSIFCSNSLIDSLWKEIRKPSQVSRAELAWKFLSLIIRDEKTDLAHFQLNEIIVLYSDVGLRLKSAFYAGFSSLLKMLSKKDIEAFVPVLLNDMCRSFQELSCSNLSIQDIIQSDAYFEGFAKAAFSLLDDLSEKRIPNVSIALKMITKLHIRPHGVASSISELHRRRRAFIILSLIADHAASRSQIALNNLKKFIGEQAHAENADEFEVGATDENRASDANSAMKPIGNDDVDLMTDDLMISIFPNEPNNKDFNFYYLVDIALQTVEQMHSAKKELPALSSIITVALSCAIKLMVVDRKICQIKVKDLFRLFTSDGLYNELIRCSILKGSVDLVMWRPSLLEPYNALLLNSARDSCPAVRTQALKTLLYLVDRDMLKIKHEVTPVALSLLNDRAEEVELCKIFFVHLTATDEGKLYNLLPETIDALVKYEEISNVQFEIVIEYLFSFIGKEKLKNGLMEKVSSKMQTLVVDDKHIDWASGLRLTLVLRALNLSDKGKKMFLDNYAKLVAPLLKDADIAKVIAKMCTSNSLNHHQIDSDVSMLEEC